MPSSAIIWPYGPSARRGRHASAHGPCASPLVQVPGARGGQGPTGSHRQTVGSTHGERDGPLRVEEVDDHRGVDAGQAEEFVADDRGRRLGAPAGLEAGEGRGHLGTFAELAGEPGLRSAERRDVALDRHVPGGLAARAADRRDRRLLLVERAVLAPIDQRPGPALATRQTAPQRPVEGRRLAAALEDPRVLPDRLVTTVAGHPLEGRVDVFDRAREIGDQDRLARLLDRLGELAILDLESAELGDVGEEADVARHPVHDGLRSPDVGQQDRAVLSPGREPTSPR